MDVYFLIPTYGRESVLKQAITALEDNISGVNRHYVVGDDHPDRGARNALSGLPNVTVLDGPSGSLGANLNRLLSHVASIGGEYVFQMDDDHILLQRLDLANHVRTLGENNSIGWIRLMGVSGHKYTATLDELYWIISWSSKELYITSNRPHIKRLDWHVKYGMYPEGKRLGETEEAFCHQCIDTGKLLPEGLPNSRVAVPVRDHDWDHIGQSWQMLGM